MINVIIGHLLKQANANPHIFGKYRFYPLKDLLLRRYGKRQGYDLQYFEKLCWSCSGTGVFTGYDDGVRWVTVPPEPCRRCVKGIYSLYWVVLDRFKVGKFLFHRPNQRVYHRRYLPENPVATIIGYVQHKSVAPARSAESFLWLSLIFQPSTFISVLGVSQVKLSLGLHVLTWINNLVFMARRIVAAIQTKRYWKIQNTRASHFEVNDLPF